MNSKINILFLVEGFGMGGVAKANISMINRIDKNKFNVHVLHYKEGILMGDLTDDIVISKLDYKAKLISLSTYFCIIKIIDYIKKNDIDVIHSMAVTTYVVGAIAAHFTNINHIRTQPNFIRRHEKLNTKTLKLLPFEKWTHKYITYQYASAKDLNLAGVDMSKIETFRGFSKAEDFLYFNDIVDIRGELNIPKESKIILAVHRMVEKKGYETFIDMIPHIVKKYKNVTFLLVGDGPLRKKFEERVESLGVSEYVRFTGFRKDLANIVKQIDFGVYPLADTAAMLSVILSGKILITKKNSSMDEYIIDGETGYLVPKDTPEEYAKYALMLLQNEEQLRKMETNQEQYVLRNFDGVKNIKKLENIFINLCRNSKEV